MKNLFLITPIAFLFLMFSSPMMTMGQNAKRSIDENFSWDTSNETKTIYMKVDNGARKITMDFDGHISEGAFNLTAYDPEGNKVGGFSLVCSSGEGTHVHVDVTEGNHQHTHVHTDGNSTHSSHSDSNHGSNTRSTSSTTTTTEVTSDGKLKTKSKSKSKKKGKGEYSYSSSNSDSKGSKGVMKKTISDPDAGKWKFVLEASKVTGTLTARVTQD